MYTPVLERRSLGVGEGMRSYRSASSVAPPTTSPPPAVRHRRFAASVRDRGAKSAAPPPSAADVWRACSRDIQRIGGCAHFHFESVELGRVRVAPTTRPTPPHPSQQPDAVCYGFSVESNGRAWTVERSYRELVEFDKQLHRCVFDRRYSRLREFHSPGADKLVLASVAELCWQLEAYFRRFSDIAGSLITCYPVLKWLELDNRGNRLLGEEAALNTPALGAAFVSRAHAAAAADELTLQVGDIVSLIDMPTDCVWWRGKLTIPRAVAPAADPSHSPGCSSHRFEVGFFPSYCVQMFGLPKQSSVDATQQEEAQRPVWHGRGKLLAYMRDFLTRRPSRKRLKERGILRERVFGCDLAEHLHGAETDVPVLLLDCATAIEALGVVNGIYRQPGVQSNIQRLRNSFDSGAEPKLDEQTIERDIHSLASLLKMYFRELPNPLFTYQLYGQFVEAVDSRYSRVEKLTNLKRVVQQLPPPHFRAAEYLLKHLSRMSHYAPQTGMDVQNLAIVWAPNLFRSYEQDLNESAGASLLHGINTQAHIVEHLVRHVDDVFGAASLGSPTVQPRTSPVGAARPASMTTAPACRLIDLDTAREKLLACRQEKVPSDAGLPDLTGRACVDIDGAASVNPGGFHTVLEMPRSKSSSAGWRSLFGGASTKRGSALTAADEPALRSPKGWSLRRQMRRRQPAAVDAAAGRLSRRDVLSPIRVGQSDAPVAQDQNELVVRRRRQKLRLVKSADSNLDVDPLDTAEERTSWGAYLRHRARTADRLLEQKAAATLPSSSVHAGASDDDALTSFSASSVASVSPAIARRSSPLPYLETDIDAMSLQDRHSSVVHCVGSSWRATPLTLSLNGQQVGVIALRARLSSYASALLKERSDPPSYSRVAERRVMVAARPVTAAANLTVRVAEDAPPPLCTSPQLGTFAGAFRSASPSPGGGGVGGRESPMSSSSASGGEVGAILATVVAVNADDTDDLLARPDSVVGSAASDVVGERLAAGGCDCVTTQSESRSSSESPVEAGESELLSQLRKNPVCEVVDDYGLAEACGASDRTSEWSASPLPVEFESAVDNVLPLYDGDDAPLANSDDCATTSAAPPPPKTVSFDAAISVLESLDRAVTPTSSASVSSAGSMRLDMSHYDNMARSPTPEWSPEAPTDPMQTSVRSDSALFRRDAYPPFDDSGATRLLAEKSQSVEPPRRDPTPPMFYESADEVPMRRREESAALVDGTPSRHSVATLPSLRAKRSQSLFCGDDGLASEEAAWRSRRTAARVVSDGGRGRPDSITFGSRCSLLAAAAAAAAAQRPARELVAPGAAAACELLNSPLFCKQRRQFDFGRSSVGGVAPSSESLPAAAKRSISTGSQSVYVYDL